jgi:hypothetical protein
MIPCNFTLLLSVWLLFDCYYYFLLFDFLACNGTRGSGVDTTMGMDFDGSCSHACVLAD